MIQLFHWMGAALLPLCGWLTGAALQAGKEQHILQLRHTVELLRHIRQEVAYRRPDMELLCRCLIQEGLLTGLCFLAQCTAAVVSPLLQSYLAVSMACCISTQRGLSDTCRATGALLQKGLRWAGRLFAVLLGLQRAITVQLDRSALRLGELFTGSVPVIGQALSDTAEVFLTGMRLLKSSLGLAALMVIGAEFLPLYVQLMLHLAFLTVCSLLCGLAANSRCQALFDCMAEAVKCMAAITALYFELLTVGVGLLMMTGGG